MNSRKQQYPLVKQFYVHHADSFKVTTRSNAFGIVILAIETFYFFSLMLCSSYTQLDNTGDLFTTLSIHDLSDTTSEYVIIAILCLNVVITALIIFLFVAYCIDRKPIKRSLYLSTLVMNYNYCIVIPSITLSTKLIDSDALQFNASIYVINLIWTLLIELICCIHSTKSYSFFDSKLDCMAKFGSAWDYIKYPILSIAIILIEVIDQKRTYTYLTFVFSALNIYDFLLKNTYYSQIMNHAHFAYFFNLLCMSLTIEVQLRWQSQSQVTAVVIFLSAIIPLSWSVGGTIVTQYYEKMDLKMQECLIESQRFIGGGSSSSSSSPQTSSTYYSSREREYYLDFFTRSLLNETEFCAKDQKLMLSVFKQSVRFPSEPEDDGDAMKYRDKKVASHSDEDFGSLISRNEYKAIMSMKAQVKSLLNYFGCRERHNGKSEAANVSMWELFYLLEIEQNVPKLSMSIQKFLHGDQTHLRSLQELALINSLQNKLERIEQDLREQSFLQLKAQVLQVGGQTNSSNNNHRRSIRHKGRFIGSSLGSLDFSKQFRFQEDLKLLELSIVRALKLKLDFLNSISENIIELSIISVLGKNLIKLIKQISQEIRRLQLKSINCKQLTQLTLIFVDCLWLDPVDRKQRLLKKFNQIELNRVNSTSAILSSTSHNNHSIDFNDMNRAECVLLISLSEKRFGRIVNVSDNSVDVTGYNSNELINQNCGIVMPIAIAYHHNSFIRKGIEYGMARIYSNERSPMILKHKDGFGLRISLQLQINIMHDDGDFSEIGLAGKMCIEERNEENYILFDASVSRSKIEVVSCNIYERLFGYYFTSPKDINGKELGQMIPIVHKLNEYMTKRAKKEEVTFKSLMFLPTGPLEHTKRRLQDTSANLIGSAKRHYFNQSCNDVFIANFTAKQYIRDNEYSLILLKVEDILQVSPDELDKLCKQYFIPHLSEYAGLSEDASNKVSEYILNGRNFTQEQTTTQYFGDGTSKQKFIATDEEDDQEYIEQQHKHQKDQAHENNPFDAEEQDDGLKVKVLRKNKQQSQIHVNDDSTLSNSLRKTVSNKVVDHQDVGTLLHMKTNKTIIAAEPQNQSYSALNNSTLLISQQQYKNHQFEELNLLDQSRGGYETIRQQSSSTALVVNGMKERSRQDLSVKRIGSQNNSSRLHNPVNRKMNKATVEEWDENLVSESDGSAAERYEKQRKQRLRIPVLARPFMQENYNISTSQNEKQETHRGSITSKQSSQSSSALQDALFRGISASQKSQLQFNLIAFISLSFISIITIVCVVYMNIRSQIATQELSFEYSWWQDKMQDSQMSMLRLTQASLLFRYTRVTQNSDEIKIFKNGITSTTAALYFNCLSLFESLYQNDYNDLYLIELLFSTRLPYQRYTGNATYQELPYTMMQTFLVQSYKSNLYSKQILSSRFLVEQDLVYNMDTVTDTIDGITQKQIVSEGELIDNMKSQVFLSLIFILSLCSIIACILLIFYWAFQAKKQFILRLFSSIAPESISKMYEGSANGITSIKIGMLNNIHNNSRAIDNSQTNKNMEIQKQIIKVKKNLSTSQLTKIPMQFALQVLSILVIINVQPVVNQILITAQVSESEQELSIVRNLYDVSTSLVYAEWAIFATTKKIAAPTTTYIPESVFTNKVYQFIDDVDVSISQLQTTITSLSSSSRYSDTSMGNFIDNIFKQNACDALANAKASYFYNNGDLVYNNTLCLTLFDGVFKRGYLNAVNTFYMMLQQYGEITSSDATSKVKSALYVTFYNTNTPLEMENLFTMIKIAQMAVINCISEEKQQYYQTIDLTQMILFVFEVCFILLLFPSIVLPFFMMIKRQMVEVVEIIQILQIQYIQENSYICNYIKQNNRI